MRLSEMKQLLAQGGLRLTKSLGQNFLHDANQLRRIVAAAELSRADKVLEIGPGLGPLTELLLAEAGEVVAIEKDVRLVQCLKAKVQSPKSEVQSPESSRSAKSVSEKSHFLRSSRGNEAQTVLETGRSCGDQ